MEVGVIAGLLATSPSLLLIVPRFPQKGELPIKKPPPKQGPGTCNETQSIRELDHPGNSWNPPELMDSSKRDDNPQRYSGSGNQPRIEANETNGFQDND